MCSSTLQLKKRCFFLWREKSKDRYLIKTHPLHKRLNVFSFVFLFIILKDFVPKLICLFSFLFSHLNTSTGTNPLKIQEVMINVLHSILKEFLVRFLSMKSEISNRDHFPRKMSMNGVVSWFVFSLCLN